MFCCDARNMGQPVTVKSQTDLVQAVARAAADVKKPDKKLVYGTAGFRDNNEVLDSTCFRMGALAVLRAIRKGAPVGIMVTASHNPAVDNGLKIADASGGMLHASWEAHCTTLANCDDVEAAIREIAAAEGLESALTTLQSCNASVFIGRDTRDSSPRLMEHCVSGIRAMGGTPIDLGVITTPQLHHVVYSFNRKEEPWASVPGYFDKISDAFLTLVEGAELPIKAPLFIDCANGVGALHLDPLVAKLNGKLEIKYFNRGETTENLNKDCGAEHVQKKRAPPTMPEGMKTWDDELNCPVRFSSFDGDADRVVFFCFDKDGTFQLQDGDKIAVLAADFINEQLAIADPATKCDVKLGIVQTAYANGAAHDVVAAKGIECPYAKTGVKFCHHRAEEFDIGIYFEANGHGTVLFKDHVVKKLEAKLAEASKADEKVALKKLLATAQLFNQAVGDSTCDALFVEAVLANRKWTIEDWANTYAEKPSRQTKVYVKDRKVVKPIEDETRLIETEAPSSTLQAKIDELAAKVSQGRAFCRPSGTEDVVRVYAEAATEAEADQLAQDVAMAIYDTVDGVGDKPVFGQWQ